VVILEVWILSELRRITDHPDPPGSVNRLNAQNWLGSAILNIVGEKKFPYLISEVVLLALAAVEVRARQDVRDGSKP
jgi:hypothetical protein